MRLYTIFLSFLLLSAHVAKANYVMYGLPVLRTVTQFSANVLPFNNLRSTIDIINGGPSTAYVQFSTISQYTGTATQTIAYQGIPVISGQTIHIYPAPANPVWADSQGSAAMTFIQGQ